MEVQEVEREALMTVVVLTDREEDLTVEVKTTAWNELNIFAVTEVQATAIAVKEAEQEVGAIV